MKDRGELDVVALFRQRKIRELRERAKELGCLYSVSSLLERKDLSVDDMLRDLVEVIPPSWQYPQVTHGRIVLDGREFTTATFEETPWRISSEIVVDGEPRGRVEVYYSEHKPPEAEGPFLREERYLINEISTRIAQEIARRSAERELHESERRYRNLVQRLPFAILVLDGDRIVFANAVFSALVGADRDCVLDGRSFLDFVHVDCRKGVRELLGTRAASHGSLPPLDIKLIRMADKSVVNVEATVVRTESGTDGEIQIVLQDIRDRHEALARNLFDRLSKRERQVMKMVVSGETSKVIAAHLGLSPKTVENHRVRLMRKMKAHSLADLILKARMLGNF